MKIGVQLPEVERVVRWDEIRRMAVLAEEVGLDSLWVGDHYLYRQGDDVRGPWEAWTQLAAIAASTTRITIGPLVAALAFHQPTVLAKMASTVDEISNGRLILGVGAGWNQTEFLGLGVPFDQRVGRFGEAFDIVRRLLAGETLSYHGAFYDVEDFVLHPVPASNRTVPLMIGSIGRKMLDITLLHVAAWNVWFTTFGNSPDRIAGCLHELDDGCQRVGRDPATIEKSVALLLDFGSAERRQGSVNPITGTTQQMADALQAVAAAGIDHVQVVLDPITEATIESLGAVVAMLRG